MKTAKYWYTMPHINPSAASQSSSGQEAGATLEDVVRPRILLTGGDDGAAMGGTYLLFVFFPSTRFMQIGRFIDPAWLGEFEAAAVIGEEG